MVFLAIEKEEIGGRSWEKALVFNDILLRVKYKWSLI